MIAFLSNMFGYVLNYIYEIVSNYGIAIIIFSILLKLILLPLSIKQQKTMKKTAKIQEKSKKIQEKYKNEPEKMNSEIMNLYKQEKMSPFGGCLGSIVQIILLFAMFYLVRSPLTFMKKIDTKKIDNIKSYISQEMGEEVLSKNYPEISIVKYVSKIKNKDEQNIKQEEKTTEEVEDVENNIKEEEQTENENEDEEENNKEKIEITDEEINQAYINMNFIGLDLSNVPLENKEDITVFIIPLLYVVSSIISLKLTTQMGKKKEKEDIIEVKAEETDKAEENTKKEDDLDISKQMGKSMSWFMPVMSVSIALVAPLGLALYWLINNILMIGERLIINKFMDAREEEE